MTRRVAVTGIGVVAPGGIGVPAFWDLLSNGRTATRGITLFDPEGLRSRIAAECDFDPLAHGLDIGVAERADRYIQFALVAAQEAVADSGVDFGAEDPWRVAVSLGSAVGGTTRLEHDYVLVSERGRRWDVDHRAAEPQLHRAFSPSTLAADVAERFGAQGPVQTVSTGCTSGLDAVGYAFHTIEEGRADICIAGASDSPISPITMACFDAIKATSPNNDDPEHASRPFDAQRDGFVMGEGAAVLVLEDLEHARARGAHIYCEIGGYATFGNAYHMTGLTCEGLEMARAIDDTPRPRARGPHGDRLRQRARLGHPPERPARDRRGQEVAGRPCLRHAHELHQVHGGPLARRDRRDRGRRLCARAGPAGGAADGELRDPGPRVRPGLRPAHRTPAQARQRALRGQRLRRVPVRGAPDGAEWEETTMSGQRTRHTAVTGLGVVAPNGLDADTYWKSVKEGASVLDRVTREGCEHLPLRVAGEVRGFDPSALIEETFLVQTDKFTHFALAAADAALQDAGLSSSDSRLAVLRRCGHRCRVRRR